ncbi:MAG: DNA alkylation repair protein [Chloroflexia bacterium]
MAQPTCEQIVNELTALSDPIGLEVMARFGDRPKKALGGLSAPQLKAIAKRAGRSHALAADLWATGIYEARLVATMVDEPAKVTEAQMDAWAVEFDSWAICDCCCSYLFDKTPYAYTKAVQWAERDEEYVKRAGFAMMAVMAVHDKKAPDDCFVQFLPIIKAHADDSRNFVKKAVNWALRQIGKRNLALNHAAIETAHEIHALPHSAAKWIASDALRELTGAPVQSRLRSR